MIRSAAVWGRTLAMACCAALVLRTAQGQTTSPPSPLAGERESGAPAVTNAEQRLEEIAREMDQAREQIQQLRVEFQARHKALYQKRLEAETKDRDIARLKQRAEELENELVKLRDDIQQRLENVPVFKDALDGLQDVQGKLNAHNRRLRELTVEHERLTLQQQPLNAVTTKAPAAGPAP